MRTKFLIAVLLSSLMLLTGCWKKCPSPSEEEVKKLTLNISGELLRNQILSEIAPKGYGYPPLKYEAWKNELVNLESAQSEKDNEYLPVLRDTILEVDKNMRDLHLSLDTIRLTSKDSTIGKVGYDADLLLGNGKKIGIICSAQYTEGGKLYVRVKLDNFS